MNKSRIKKRVPWIEVACIGIIALLSMTFILLSSSTKSNAIQTSSKVKNTEIKKEDSTKESAFPGILIKTEVSNDEYSPYSMQYPHSKVESFNVSIKKYIDEQLDTYLIAMQENKQRGSKIPGELNIAFEIFPHTSGSFSFVMITGMYTGGANGYTEFNTINFHPKSEKIIGINDLFGGDESNLVKLSSLVRDNIKKDPSLKDQVQEEEMLLATEPRWSNFEQFAIIDDTLVIYFDEYEIASGAAGAPIIAVPLSELNEELLAPYKLDISVDRLPKPPVEDNSVDVKVEENSKDETSTQVDQQIDDTKMKRVALTFDDGPDPKVTPSILTTLAKYDAKATFFMLGSRVEFYPEIASDVLKAGHELGNHTWTHAKLTNMTTDAILEEVSKTNNIIEQSTGQEPTVFRPPYGAFNDDLVNILNLPVVLWDVDTLDWKHRDASQLLVSVKSSVHDGSTILMHDIHLSTAQGLEDVLVYLISEGYTFVTVSELE
ncbi:polysaccharide deacetylase family protein [Psychrobacillus antarcticus]|uniref:polysaccharide deacetylase family protein n=1 Tax=Psychrobacillus antarcticus TaxID=2879115 RepID=UPI002408774D|nr:polysaccharide deacetylase family protein [Psychrobacillus antarcticus]